MEDQNFEEHDDIYDGMLVIGKLTQIKELKSRKTGNTVDGIANAVFDTSRGEQILSVQRVLRTPMGAFNLPAFDKLLDRQAVGQTWIVKIGAESSGGFTNFVAIDCKVVA